MEYSKTIYGMEIRENGEVSATSMLRRKERKLEKQKHWAIGGSVLGVAVIPTIVESFFPGMASITQLGFLGMPFMWIAGYFIAAADRDILANRINCSKALREHGYDETPLSSILSP